MPVTDTEIEKLETQRFRLALLVGCWLARHLHSAPPFNLQGRSCRACTPRPDLAGPSFNSGFKQPTRQAEKGRACPTLVRHH